MRVDHGRSDISVTQQLLYRSDIVAVFQQVGRKRMPQRMTGRRFGNPLNVADLLFQDPLIQEQKRIERLILR